MLECEKDQKNTLASFRHIFTFFGQKFLVHKKNIIRDIVNLWYVTTAKTILDVYEIMNIAISYLV